MNISDEHSCYKSNPVKAPHKHLSDQFNFYFVLCSGVCFHFLWFILWTCSKKLLARDIMFNINPVFF